MSIDYSVYLNPEDLDLLLLWGKTSGKDHCSNTFHPVIYHMIDVGNVAAVLLGEKTSPRWRGIINSSFGISVDEFSGFIPWLVSLHDIGKVSSDFQSQNPSLAQNLFTAGFPIGKSSGLKHTTIGQISILCQQTDLLPSFPYRLVVTDMVGGHHGNFCAPGKAKEAYPRLLAYENPKWEKYRNTISLLLKHLFFQDNDPKYPEIVDLSAAGMALTGFTILCDWLGSDETYFQPHSEMCLEEYIPFSKEQAKLAVSNSGFYLPSISKIQSGFSQIFPELTAPRPLQKAVDGIPDEFLRKPCLVIIEAPTGEGKTEAALAIAHRMAKLDEIAGCDDLYFALPTTATSNQMFIRLQQYLDTNLNLETGINLVHGQAFLVKDDLTVKPLFNGNDEGYDNLMAWFGPKKKALLASFGVGTIDQLELAAMNVRHNALRMIGLAGKTVIIDEVHAYDAYMSTIIQHTLKWLSSLGTSVILLSATLPLNRRNELFKAFLGETIDRSKLTPTYPSLAVFNKSGSWQASPAASQQDRKISVHQLCLSDDNPEEKAVWLLKEVENGGCACWITNTVNRSQQIYKAVRALAPGDVKCILLHSRFPLDNRQIIEKELRENFGPGNERPEKGIVIGTQVLEQSLDIDFDVLVTDLAPIDLLLQRVGRLHRHSHHWRPERHKEPRLFINVNRNDQGEILLALDKLIYAEFLLRRTWDVIQGITSFVLPDDYRRLIESIYDDSNITRGDKYFEEWMRFKKNLDVSIEKALFQLIPLPRKKDTFSKGFNNLIFEENEENSIHIAAQTRLGQEGITVIPLEKSQGVIQLQDYREPILLDRPADRSIQLALLRHGLKIEDRDIVRLMKHNLGQLPEVFRKSPLLKEAFPLWFVDGKAVFQDGKNVINLVLDQELGLIIQKQIETGNK